MGFAFPSVSKAFSAGWVTHSIKLVSNKEATCVRFPTQYRLVCGLSATYTWDRPVHGGEAVQTEEGPTGHVAAFDLVPQGLRSGRSNPEATADVADDSQEPASLV